MLDKIKRWREQGQQRRNIEKAMRLEKRLPPGQRVTLKFPVLHLGRIPPFDPNRWHFKIWGAVAKPIKLSWAEFQALPRQTRTLDLHCVTQWSKFDTVWEGVSLRTLIECGLLAPDANATHLIQVADGGYKTNLPLKIALPTHKKSKIIKITTRWQKQQSFIQHFFLVLIFGGPLFLLELSWPVWLTGALTAIIWVFGIRLAVILNNYFAKTMVRIFQFESDVAVGIVQRVLRDKYIRFNRREEANHITFELRQQALILTVESFPLNLPIDDHIKETPATKVALQGLNSQNKAFAEMLSEAINEMANERVFKRRPS